MNSEMYKAVDTICYSQPGGVFYACPLPAASIIGRLDIRRRSDNPDRGMQRDENYSRVKEISRYALETNAVFPTPIIVSAYSNILLEDGKVMIPKDESSVGHVLDGQHRLLGLKELSQEDLVRFDLLIVFVFEIDVYSEATIFSTINSTQKQVSKSLMYDLFSLYPGRSPEKTAHEIVRSLNDDPESPFHGKIKILGKKMADTETLSQAAFVDQIVRQLKDKSGHLNKYYERDQDWVIRKIISSCFTALLQAQTQAKNDAFPPDYFLKTTGFGGVAQSLKELVAAGAMKSDLSQVFFKDVMTDLFTRLKAPPEGVGNSAMLRIKEAILAGVTPQLI